MNLQKASLVSVARHCKRESARFRRGLSHNPSYCYELWRRALQERDQHAWVFLHKQYHLLVTSWVTRHQHFRETNEEAEYFVQGAFMRIWRAITPEKFSDFGHLGALLRFLQICVHSDITDHLRHLRKFSLESDKGLEEYEWEQVLDQLPLPDDQVVDEEWRQKFWRCLMMRFSSKKEQQEKERLVIYGCYVLGLKPRDDWFTDKCGDGNEVSRIKDNFIRRLRRPRNITKFQECLDKE